MTSNASFYFSRYYMIELSFYWALCISQFFDVKRKDFWEMFIHHVTTIALMAFSWTCNLTRVGTLVLVIHDCADIFLEVCQCRPLLCYLCSYLLSTVVPKNGYELGVVKLFKSTYFTMRYSFWLLTICKEVSYFGKILECVISLGCDCILYKPSHQSLPDPMGLSSLWWYWKSPSKFSNGKFSCIGTCKKLKENILDFFKRWKEKKVF